MWTLSDLRRLSGKRALRAAALLLVLGLTAAMAAWAAPQEAVATGDRAELRQLIERRYTVLPISGGILLTPRTPRAGVRTIEITGDNVAINGQRVSGDRTIREWLEGDADLILRLRGLSPDERRQTFNLESLPPGERPAEPIPEPAEDAVEAPTSGDVTEVTPGEAEEAEEAEPAEPAEPAEETVSDSDRRSSGDRINVGGSVKVDKDEITNEAVAIGGSVTVDGEVRDAVTAIGGSARINGRVGGEVVSVGGGVYLGPNAVVEGGVTSVGGRIHRQPGAVIHGPTSEVGLLPFTWNDGWRRGPWSYRGGISDVMGSIMTLVVMSLLVCLVLLVARRPLERVDRMLATQPWQSAAVGVAGFVFLVPLLVVVTVLLVITIVGCTLLLLYPFLFIYLGLLFLLGYAAVAHRLGRWFEGRFNLRFGSPYVAALIGVLLIQIWSVLGQMLDLVPGPFGFFAGMMLLFAALMSIAAWIVGFGAVILARFGLEPGYWPGRVAAAPPPVPPGPLPLTDPLTNPPVTERWEDPGLPYPPESTEPPR